VTNRSNSEEKIGCSHRTYRHIYLLIADQRLGCCWRS